MTLKLHTFNNIGITKKARHASDTEFNREV